MYSVIVRDHVMIAHSLPDPFFGPAAKMHGATYVIDAEFISAKLDAHNVVIDIGEAHNCLKKALDPLNYQNLDKIPEFANTLTTTEFLARHLFNEVAKLLGDSFKGELKITLHESHVASASFRGSIS